MTEEFCPLFYQNDDKAGAAETVCACVCLCLCVCVCVWSGQVVAAEPVGVGGVSSKPDPVSSSV